MKLSTNTLLVIISIFAILNLSWGQDFNINSISYTNSVFHPDDYEHEVPLDGKFKINIELKDDNNDDIIIDEDDTIFDDLSCILNGTIMLDKYVNYEGNFVCSYLCGFDEMSGTDIIVKHDTNIIKEYLIGEYTGILDPESTIIVSHQSEIFAGDRVSIVVKLFDTYGNKLSVGTGSHYYDKIECYTSVGIMNKVQDEDGLKCFTDGDDSKIVGDYTINVDYTDDDDVVHLLGTHDYSIKTDSLWHPNHSDITFPSSSTSFSDIKIKINVARDVYGNTISYEKAFPLTNIYILNASNDSIIRSFTDVNRNSNFEFSVFNDIPSTLYIKLKICVLSSCKVSGSIFSYGVV